MAVRSPHKPLYCSPCNKTPWKNGVALPRSTAKWATSKSATSSTRSTTSLPNAQQILRDELKKRGIVEPGPSGSPFPSSSPQHARDRRTISHFVPASAEVTRSEQEEEEDDDGPREYTWKTLLCECQDLAEAKAVATMLMGAGIESWIERPQQYYVDPSSPCVKVAADQLEHAQAVIAQPIPQEHHRGARELKPLRPTKSPAAPSAKPKTPPSNPSNHPTTGSANPAATPGPIPSPIQPHLKPQISPQKTERAARQQGSSFLRENSSNGGKTIRTFWLHSRCGDRSVKNKSESI